jgi:hypothetical protein
MLTKEEYVQRYAGAHKIPVAEVLKHMVPVRCDCEDPQCVGWAMTNVGEAVVLSMEEARHYILTLRRVLTSRHARSVGMVDGVVLSQLLRQLESQASPQEAVTVMKVDSAPEETIYRQVSDTGPLVIPTEATSWPPREE